MSTLTIVDAPAFRSLAGNVNPMVVQSTPATVTSPSTGQYYFELLGLPTEGQQIAVSWPALGYSILFTVGSATGTGSGTTLPKPSGETLEQYANKILSCFWQVPEIERHFQGTWFVFIGNIWMQTRWTSGLNNVYGPDYDLSIVSVGPTSFPLISVSAAPSVAKSLYPNRKVFVEVYASSNLTDPFTLYTGGLADTLTHYQHYIGRLSAVPDEDGRSTFDVNELVRSIVEAPTVVTPQRALMKVSGKWTLTFFILRMYESYGDPPEIQSIRYYVPNDPTIDESTLTHYTFMVLPGAVSEESYYRTFLNSFEKRDEAPTVRRFLTLDHYKENRTSLDREYDIRVSEASPVMLYFLKDYSTNTVTTAARYYPWVKFYYANNTESEWLALELPVGLDDFFPTASDYALHAFYCGWHNVKHTLPGGAPEVVRYAVSVVKGTGNKDQGCLMSFVLDKRPKMDEHYIMYLNDLGVWEVMSFFGNAQQGAVVEREYVRKAVGPGYSTNQSTLHTIRNVWKDQREISTDLVTRGEKRQVLSVLRSKETYLYFGSTEPIADNTQAGAAYGRWVRCYVDAEDTALYGSLDDLTGATVKLYVGDEQEGGYAPQNGYVEL